jgi:hypothetical protein
LLELGPECLRGDLRSDRDIARRRIGRYKFHFIDLDL